MRHFHASQRTRKKNTHVRRKKKIAAGLLACLLSGVFFSQNALARHKEAAPAPAEMQQAVKALATAADEKDTKDTKNAKVTKKEKKEQAKQNPAIGIQQKVAEILREHVAQNAGKKPFKSHVMKMWPVESKDEGGTLLFSDSPESVTEDGILYQDTVKGEARILYYHLNSSDSDKKVAVVLQSADGQPAIVRVTRGGACYPSPDYLHVGKMTQMAYFEGEAHGDIYIGRGATACCRRIWIRPSCIPATSSTASMTLPPTGRSRCRSSCTQPIPTHTNSSSRQGCCRRTSSACAAHSRA